MLAIQQHITCEQISENGERGPKTSYPPSAAKLATTFTA